MKVHEVLQEGPMLDRLKSGIAGAKAGYTQSKFQRQGQERIDKLAKDAEPYWIKTQTAYQQRGIPAEQLGEYLTQWVRKWYKVSTIPDYSSAIGAQYNPIGVKKYLQLGASYYIAPDELPIVDLLDIIFKDPEEFRKAFQQYAETTKGHDHTNLINALTYMLSSLPK